jgi:hypothetical protein
MGEERRAEATAARRPHTKTHEEGEGSDNEAPVILILGLAERPNPFARLRGRSSVIKIIANRFEWVSLRLTLAIGRTFIVVHRIRLRRRAILAPVGILRRSLGRRHRLDGGRFGPAAAIRVGVMVLFLRLRAVLFVCRIDIIVRRRRMPIRIRR